MLYKQIVEQAWALVQEEKKSLFILGFIPSFFGMIIGVIWVTYQINAFKHSSLFSIDGGGLDYFALLTPVWEFLKFHPGASALIVLMSFIVFLLYMITPIICGAALIDLITKKLMGKPLKGGVVAGFSSFFPLFEFTAVTAAFGIPTFLTELSLVLRNFGTGTWVFLIPLLTTVLVIGLFLTLLFIFAEQFIILEKKNVIQAMKASAMMVLTNVRDTFFLGIGMALVAIRVLLNIVLVLFIPLVFISIVALMASFALKWLGILIGVIIGLAMFIGGAYLMAGFHIFMYAVWTISFVQFRKEEVANQLNGVIEE